MMRGNALDGIEGKTIKNYDVDQNAARLTIEFEDGTAVELHMDGRAHGSVWVDVRHKTAGQERAKPWKPWLPHRLRH